MKKTIKRLIGLGYKVLALKGYDKFTTPYVNIMNNEGYALALKVDEKKDEINVVKFLPSNSLSDSFQTILIAKITGYIDESAKDQLKQALDYSFEKTKMTLENNETHIPEELRGVKSKNQRVEDVFFSNSNTMERDRAIKEGLDDNVSEEIFKNQWIYDFLDSLSNDTINEKPEKPEKKKKCRKFDYGIFINNVIKEVLNSKDNIITYDINDDMIAFNAYNNHTGEYLWTVFIDLLSLTDDSIPFINNVDIYDGSVSIYSIFNHKNNIDEFIRFYKNFVRDANCKCE